MTCCGNLGCCKDRRIVGGVLYFDNPCLIKNGLQDRSYTHYGLCINTSGFACRRKACWGRDNRYNLSFICRPRYMSFRY